VDFSVAGLLGGEEDPFRPALPAEEATEVAATLGIEPWWGTDPTGAQGGLEILAQGAEGDFRWFRARGAARLAVPLLQGVRAGLEVEGGRIWGDAPFQRHWFLGGTRSLRGYPGASAVGTSHLRGRAELARDFGAARWSAFSDWGWAGDAASFEADDALLSAGVGLSVLDGLLRFDVARALRAPTGWRVELYLDALL
jgi:hemolysin activation/secretion protein